MNLSQRQLDALEHITEHCRKVAQLVGQLQSLDGLMADWKAGYALMRCVEVIGEAATRLGPQFHAERPEIPWRLVIGIGNQLVGSYDEVDDHALWQTASKDLPELYRQIVGVQEASLPVYLRQPEHPPEKLEPGQRS